METWLALATTNSALVRTGFCMTGGCLGFCSLVSAACVMGLHRARNGCWAAPAPSL